ncbi:MAG: sporulation integral membrane protein YlbJ [Limnochordia bacterium]|jgi:sporulation integral membrane protein YlbJ|nr:sporulation integral membrane protein YlbJ [Limnochordia bacterium]MDD2629156.1 sporulation integral membrane protein YlbJ [Limnochordia bacterium]MDD4518035.1 sporulation integral membrane protein YlbJ [Limnochordia bacterium]
MKPLRKKKATAYFMALIAIVLTISVVRYPEDAFQASLYGLDLWFKVVLPALLPFFALAEILMGLGVVHFMGALLEPLMRPLFAIPGTGGFALAMGLASGYPIGAKITGRLRRENLCSQAEAERLVAFANTADPLFIIGAVAVGMFGMPQLGAILALSHYLSVIMLGFIMRFHGPKSDRTSEARPKENILSRALRELYRARAADGRTFGHLLSDSIKDAFSSLFFVGGCIIMFSVLIRILTLAGITDLLASVFAVILRPFGINKTIIPALISGSFEITIGSEMASHAAAPLIERIIAASAIIAWSGFSVHAQVASMVYGTDIRIFPYMLARALHSILAVITTMFLLGPGVPLVSRLLTVPTMVQDTSSIHSPLSRFLTATLNASWFLVIPLGLLLGGILVRSIKLIWFRIRMPRD